MMCLTWLVLEASSLFSPRFSDTTHHFYTLNFFFCTVLHCLAHSWDFFTLFPVSLGAVFMLQFGSTLSTPLYRDLAELAAVKEHRQNRTRESLIQK